MRRYLTLALALVLAAISVNALALGLGEIRLNSWLNQRLDAEIELVSATADELESLQVRLADQAAYDRHGLERSAELNSLQFRVVRRPNGTAYLHVTSTEAIREPFLTFLIEASWSRGRLLREYTVLLDPPTFADRETAGETAPAAVTPATPAEQPQVREQREQPVVAETRAPEPSTRVVEETRGDVISIPPLEADARTESRPIRRFEEERPGTYGPIQRNENLWSIALRLRPDDSVTVNQMMLALYRANPEAFEGNINRLKAGYILRVPEYAEITRLSRTEAFREAQRHNQEWEELRRGRSSQGLVDRAERTAEPELSLVVPEEDVFADDGSMDAGDMEGEGGFAAGEDDATAMAEEGTGELDLGLEDEESSRLLDIEDESLQALQQQDDLLGDEAADDAAAPEADELDEEPVADMPLEGEVAEDFATEPLADDAGEFADEEQPAADVEPQPEPESRVVTPVVPRQPEPSLVEKLRDFVLSPLGLGLVAALIVLALAVLLLVRRRQAAPAAAALAAEGDEETQVWIEQDEEDQPATVIAEEFDTTAAPLDEEQPEEDEISFDVGEEPQAEPAAEANDYTDTVVGAHVVALDENDPMSEADFHVAYGLFDQAADVLENALERDPSRKEWLAKLAEVHFAGNNTEGFVAAAKRLREVAGPGDAHWENVVIMGRQIAPGEPMFEEGGAGGPVDLDFDTAAAEQPATTDAGLDFEIPAAEEQPQAAPQADDLDFDFELPEAPASAEASPSIEDESTATTGTDLDFSLDEQPEQTGSDFDFDLGEFDAGTEEQGESAGFDEVDTQTEFDKALEELSAYVDTNLPTGESAVSEESAELNLDEFNFDDAAGGEDDFAEGLAEEDEGDIGEIGTKLDLARAYIDMGDPDGARGILDEVLAEGDEAQKREAQELLQQLG